MRYYFCASGALSEAKAALGYSGVRPNELLADQCEGNIIRFNDASNRTKAEVVAAFDRAIEKAVSEERAGGQA